jgi:hypothetical protein
MVNVSSGWGEFGCQAVCQMLVGALPRRQWPAFQQMFLAKNVYRWSIDLIATFR